MIEGLEMPLQVGIPSSLAVIAVWKFSRLTTTVEDLSKKVDGLNGQLRDRIDGVEDKSEKEDSAIHKRIDDEAKDAREVNEGRFMALLNMMGKSPKPDS